MCLELTLPTTHTSYDSFSEALNTAFMMQVGSDCVELKTVISIQLIDFLLLSATNINLSKKLFQLLYSIDFQLLFNNNKIFIKNRLQLFMIRTRTFYGVARLPY